MIQFKFLHTADNHIGYFQYGFVQRALDFARPMQEIALIARNEKVDFIVLAGDFANSPNLDPFSVQVLSQLVRDCKCPVLGVEGNHSAHTSSDRMAPHVICRWPDALGLRLPAKWNLDTVTAQLIPHQQHTDMADSYTVFEKNGKFLRVALVDYRPRAAVQTLLGLMPHDFCDVLVMHQRAAGFVPAVGADKADLDLDWVRGKTRYLALGDIHAPGVKTLEVKDGIETMAAYPGSTELCKIDESLMKVVYVVEFWDEDPKVRIRTIPLKTRAVEIIDDFMTAADLDKRVSDISARCQAIAPVDRPLVIIRYNTELYHSCEQAVAALNGLGFPMVKLEPRDRKADEKVTAMDFKAHQTCSDQDMMVVIQEQLKDHAPELSVAMQVWQNPGNVKKILEESFK